MVIAAGGSGLVQGMADDVGSAYNVARAQVVTVCGAATMNLGEWFWEYDQWFV